MNSTARLLSYVKIIVLLSTQFLPYYNQFFSYLASPYRSLHSFPLLPSTYFPFSYFITRFLIRLSHVCFLLLLAKPACNPATTLTPFRRSPSCHPTTATTNFKGTLTPSLPLFFSRLSLIHPSYHLTVSLTPLVHQYHMCCYSTPLTLPFCPFNLPLWPPCCYSAILASTLPPSLMPPLDTLAATAPP